MNVNGLSNAGFMGGLMQGAQFVEGMQNRTKANERAEAQAGRAQESHDQTTKLNGLKIDEAETKKLQSEFGLMTRKIRLTGEMPSKEEFKKFKPFGVDKLLNSNYIEENQNAGAAIHKARTTGEWGADAITALNTTFFDKLREKEKNTGEKHRVVDVQDMGDGRFGLMLEITGKDGKKRIAPLTKNGTPDKDDNLVLFDESKMDEIHQVQLHRANMAYLWEKNKNDPKAAADFLDGIVFPAKAKKAPGLESIYDKETGGDQKVVWNGSQYVPIGGVKADNGKGGRGDSGGSANNKQFSLSVRNYQQDLNAALETGDENAILQVKQMHKNTSGLDFDLIEKAAIYKRDTLNDYSPLTYEEFSQFNQQMNNASANADVNELISNNAELFGNQNPQQDSAPDGLVQVDPIPQAPQVPNNDQGLSSAAGFRGMPNITPEQRQGVDAINQTKAQVKTQLMGELDSIRSTLSSSGRRTPTKREADLLKAIREIDSAYDMDSLNTAIAKMKLGEKSQKPGIKDAAHMAAL